MQSRCWSTRFVSGALLWLALLSPSHASGAPALPSGFARIDLTVDGTNREALVYAPGGAAATNTPVVFVFHGHGGNARQAASSFAMDRAWPEAISVYMQGLNTPGRLTDPNGRKTGWQAAAGDQGDRDLKFFDAVLARLRHDYKVDDRRIYSTGHSNGGAFTYLLWAERGDLFAAVAPSGAAFLHVNRLKPKPAMHLAGERDPLVKFTWQQAMMAAVRKLNGCEAEGKPWDKLCTLYESGTGTPFVTFIHPGGHEFNRAAPELIVKFFKETAMQNEQGRIIGKQPLKPSPETSAGWRKCDGNPVMGGTHGTCFDVSVLREGETYRMWLSWRPKQSVAVVESKDGIHWSEPPRSVLGPRHETGWEDEINRPVVLKRGDGYHMWYTGQAKGHSAIGYATSADGLTWKRMSDKPVLMPEKPWEKVAVMCPHVLWDAGAKLFRMWYSGGDQYEPNAIGYATSPDGLAWTKHVANPVFVPDQRTQWESHKVTACQVEQVGDWHVMFYIGFSDEEHAQIGLARSRDGITGWQRHPGNPIVSPGAGKWDHDACYKPYAVFDGSKWRLWYNGRHGDLEQIGVVMHDGEDLGFQ